MTRRGFAFCAEGTATLGLGGGPFGDISAITQRKRKPAVPALETLRDHNPPLFDHLLKRQLHASHRRCAASIFETRRFSDRKPT